MNRGFCIVFGIIIVVSLLLGGFSCAKSAPAPTPAPAPKPAPPAEKITLTAVGAWHSSHWQILKFRELIAEVNKRAAGQLKIEFKGGPEIIKDSDQLSACGEGTIDMFYSVSAYFAGIVPEVGIIGLNVVPWNYDNYPKLRDAIRPGLSKILEEKTKTTYLTFFHPNPMSIFTTKVPVRKVDDLKGLKIRSPGGMGAALVEAVGAAVTMIPSPEIYTAAATGVIDGAVRPTPSVVDFKEYEVWKYMMSTYLNFNPSDTFINLNTLNKLPANLRKLLVDTAAEWDRDTVKFYIDSEKEARKDLVSKGVGMIDLTPAEVTKWDAILARAAEPFFLKVAPVHGPELIKTLKSAAGK